MANERPNLIVVIIQITNERGFFSCLIRVEFINRSKNGGPRELSLHFDTFSIFLVPLLRIYPARTSSSSLVLFLRGDSFFPPYSFYFLHRWCICIYILCIYMYIYILFFWPLRLRKSSTRDVLNRFSVNVVRFDGPLVIYDLWGCGLVPSSQRSVSDFSRGGLETETRRGIGGFVELSGNTREILIEKGML